MAILQSITDYLRSHAKVGSQIVEKLSSVFVVEDGRAAERNMFIEVDSQLWRLAFGSARRTAARERMLFAYDSGIDYIGAFFACSRSCNIAVSRLPSVNAKALVRLGSA